MMLCLKFIAIIFLYFSIGILIARVGDIFFHFSNEEKVATMCLYPLILVLAVFALFCELLERIMEVFVTVICVLLAIELEDNDEIIVVGSEEEN